MISLARVTPRMGKNYYAADSYYTKDKGVENSEWYGVGAESLGLQGEVDAEIFQGLLEGKSPRDGQKLGCEGDNREGERRAGIDATFSAPKSISLACMLGGDERLLEAHKTAVNAAIAVIEERYSLTRKGSKENRRNEVAGNIIAAQFHHDLSRAKDPQIHTHCVIMNAVKRSDGEWRSLHNDGLFSNSKIMGLVYQNELARQVQNLGYNIERKSGGTFEVAGYSEEQIKAFSKRTARIEALGAESKKEERVKKLKDRPAKGKEIPRDALKALWEQEAAAIKLSHPTPKHDRFERILAGENLHREVVTAGIRHATERDVRFKQEAVEKFALEHHLGALDWRRLQQEMGASRREKTMIEYAEGRFTTREALEVDKNILRIVEGGKGRHNPIAATLPESIEKNEMGLTSGQKSALELVLLSQDQFVAWQGVAGAGKTFAMNTLREVCTARGVTVRGFAPSAEAAKVLETEARISSDTVASLLVSKGQTSEQKKLWIVDEAGLLSARDAAALLERAAFEKARVVFVGDTRQLSAIEAGNPFKLMQEKGIATAHLSESRRQKTEMLKEAVSLMAKGKTAEGLKLLDGEIVELRRESTRVRHVTQAYMKLSDGERAKTLVLAGTNREREELTKSIRGALQAEKKIGESTPLQVLRAKDLTREEARSVVSYEVGDVLVFERGKHGFRKNENARIVGIEQGLGLLRVARADGLETVVPVTSLGASAFREMEISLAVGDRMRWTRNDREMGVRNGQEFWVVGIDGRKILVEDSKRRRFELDAAGRAHVDHAYVSTVYSSQGKTCDTVLIATDRTFGKEAMYVALSRAKISASIFTEDKGTLMKISQESRAKVSAIETVELARREELKVGVAKNQTQELPLTEYHQQRRGQRV